MIALDTNVVVRYLVRDDEEQAESARSLMEGLTAERPGFICREVMVEVAWVLGRAYKFARSHVADVLVELAATESLVVEAADDVLLAAYGHREGRADFADLMILAAAERVGARPLYTFDRKLSRLYGATLPAD